MIISNPSLNILTLAPAVACEIAKGSEGESKITYDKASSAINSSNAFISYVVLASDRKELLGTLALMPYGTVQEFTHTSKKIYFGYERDAYAFVHLEPEDDNIEIRLVDGRGKFLEGKMETIAEAIAKLPVEQQEMMRRISLGLSSKEVKASKVPHIHISKLNNKG